MSKENTATAAPATGFAFNKTKQVTLPILKKQDDVPVYVKFIGEVFTGKEVKGNSANNAKMEPARIANVINLETGEEMQLIINTVLESILNENYPDQKYVGKCFEIIQYSPSGKKYKNFRVSEGQLG